MFQNRLEENGGTLGFRDVTSAAFPANWSSGNGHYEQEMGDLDGDGDLDIYGLNWRSSPGFDDITLRNTGNGVYDSLTILSGSSDDDNEGDFLDYDLDGDLDLYVANFQGPDKLYRNNNNGGASFSFSNVTAGNIPPFVTFSPTSLDADAADVDNDGDYDVMVAADNFDRNVLLTNTTNPVSGMDNHAPVIPNVEQAPNRTSGPNPTVIRAHVYDNAPYYITWYNPTRIDYTVNGGPVQTGPMKSSAGQVFRGELPGNLVGNVCYTIVSQDQYGQVGMSATLCYQGFGSGSPFTDVCFGDGGVTPGCTPCPCSNDAPGGTIGGCLNPSGASARLLGSGNPSVAADTLRFEMTGGEPLSFAVLTSGANIAPNNAGNPCFGLDSGIQAASLDGLRCAVGAVQRHGARAIDAAGGVGITTAGWGPPNGPAGGLIVQGGFTAGQTRHFQVIYRVLATQGCGTGQNTSQAVSTNFVP